MVAVVKKHKSATKTRKNKSFLSKPIGELIIGIILLLICVGGVLAVSYSGFKSQVKVSPTPSPQTVTSTPTPFSVRTNVPQTNTDPITDCVSTHPNCKGETIRLKRSQCSQIYCCGLPSGQWILYSSKTKCETEAGNMKQTKPVTNLNLAPSGSLNYYCYDNTLKYSYYTSSGEQCNKDNLVSACKGLVKSTYDLCMQNCLSEANNGTDICIWGYGAGGQIADNPDLLQQCFDENHAEHQQCMDTCSRPYQEDSLKCSETY